jgi:hypothetical protein
MTKLFGKIDNEEDVKAKPSLEKSVFIEDTMNSDDEEDFEGPASLLQSKTTLTEANNLTDNIDIDPIKILHNRTGCTSTGRLIKAYRQQLITCSGLRRYHPTKKAHNKGHRHKPFLCGICVRTTITSKSFGKKIAVTFGSSDEQHQCLSELFISRELKVH